MRTLRTRSLTFFIFPAVPSRSSSVQSLSTSSNNPSMLHSQSGDGGAGGIGGGGFVDPARDLERMAEEGRNIRSIVDENLERNIGVTPGMRMITSQTGPVKLIIIRDNFIMITTFLSFFCQMRTTSF